MFFCVARLPGHSKHSTQYISFFSWLLKSATCAKRLPCAMFRLHPEMLESYNGTRNDGFKAGWRFKHQTRKGEYGKKKRRGTLTWNMADTLTVCFFLGHVNVKSGFLDCSCLIDLVWKGLPRCQVKLSWIGCWQLSASSSIYDFPRSLRWTGAMLISWFFVLLCYVRFHRRTYMYMYMYTYMYMYMYIYICI